MNKSKIRIILFAIIIVIIIIIISISLILYKSNKNVNDNINQDNEVDDPSEFEIDYSQENLNETDYFAISDCILQYLDLLNVNNEIYEDTPEKERSQYIYNLLSNEYIENNHININNLYDYTGKLEESPLFTIVEINKYQKENISCYGVYGLVESMDNNKLIEEIYVKVTIDIANQTFSIEPTNEDGINIKPIEITGIEEKENNVITYRTISNVDTAKELVNIYKRIILVKPEIIYDRLDKEYREKRFENLENFEKYVAENRDEIMNIKCSEYLVKDTDNYTEYVVKDEYENLYIFDVKTLVDYTIKLDTYTLEQEKFTKTYNKSDKQKKVQMNIDKFFQMINRKDYKTSYNCLDDSFKNNKIQTEQKFEEIAKKIFLKYNKVEYSNFEDVGNNTYVYSIKLTDLTGQSSETRNITIIMKLLEDTDFVISFSIEE